MGMNMGQEPVREYVSRKNNFWNKFYIDFDYVF